MKGLLARTTAAKAGSMLTRWAATAAGERGRRGRGCGALLPGAMLIEVTATRRSLPSGDVEQAQGGRLGVDARACRAHAGRAAGLATAALHKLGGHAHEVAVTLLAALREADAARHRVVDVCGWPAGLHRHRVGRASGPPPRGDFL